MTDGFLERWGRCSQVCVLGIFSSDLSGMAEDRTCPGVGSSPGGCSDAQSGPELRPHSYLAAIRSGLDDLEAGSSYGGGQQLCPYAAAGECRFGDACVYLHGDVCEICRLRVLHPFDPEQRKAHEKVQCPA